MFGSFTFHPLAIQKGYFLELVDHLEMESQTMLIAKPLRALADLIAFRKVTWQGLGWIAEGLRIDEENLSGISREDIELLCQVHKLKRVRTFLLSLAKALNL